MLVGVSLVDVFVGGFSVVFQYQSSSFFVSRRFCVSTFMLVPQLVYQSLCFLVVLVLGRGLGQVFDVFLFDVSFRFPLVGGFQVLKQSMGLWIFPYQAGVGFLRYL